jgi:hypothetical protein
VNFLIVAPVNAITKSHSLRSRGIVFVNIDKEVVDYTKPVINDKEFHKLKEEILNKINRILE